MAKTLTGTVTSNKTDKTIVITVTERKTHPLYKKQYTVQTKYMAHDEKNEAAEGDLVTIIETRPISARKRFKLDTVVNKAGTKFREEDAVADVPEEEITPKKAEKPQIEATQPESDKPTRSSK